MRKIIWKCLLNNKPKASFKHFSQPTKDETVCWFDRFLLPTSNKEVNCWVCGDKSIAHKIKFLVDRYLFRSFTEQWYYHFKKIEAIMNLSWVSMNNVGRFQVRLCVNIDSVWILQHFFVSSSQFMLLESPGDNVFWLVLFERWEIPFSKYFA